MRAADHSTTLSFLMVEHLTAKVAQLTEQIEELRRQRDTDHEVFADLQNAIHVLNRDNRRLASLATTGFDEIQRLEDIAADMLASIPNGYERATFAARLRNRDMPGVIIDLTED